MINPVYFGPVAPAFSTDPLSHTSGQESEESSLDREAEPGDLDFPEDSLHVLGQLPAPGPQFPFLKDKGRALEVL